MSIKCGESEGPRFAGLVGRSSLGRSEAEIWSCGVVDDLAIMRITKSLSSGGRKESQKR